MAKVSPSSSSSAPESHRGANKVYPESGGKYGNVASETSPAHEAAFHQWNDALTQKYAATHQTGINSPGGSMLHYPLYRGSQQKPEDVFKPGGEIKPSTVLKGKSDGSFSLSKHQMGLPSQYTSMTTSLPATQDISKFLKRDNVFVTDPQPHGRYLNGRDNTSKTDDALNQSEVSVPGSIPTEAVRGSVPVNKTTGELDFSGLTKNPHYKSPQDYGDEHGGAAASSGSPGVSTTAGLGGGQEHSPLPTIPEDPANE